ncbi:hypothetical protein GGR54DRAFT_502095 [Hypoxylon sp. NC1633]|nr:hypothetical protein GGR54DRAFT_502095 [Hypoxylon sp. NC1633]
MEKTKEEKEEIERLQGLIREERRATQRLDEETQRTREETQWLNEETQRKHEETQRLNEETQRLREETQRLNEERRELEKKVQPQTLPQYLDASHSHSLTMRTITPRAASPRAASSTTQSDVTNSVERIFPRRIIPWDDGFAAGQKQTWEKLLTDPSFFSSAIFPSPIQFEYMVHLFGESFLRFYEVVVETEVERSINYVYENPTLRDSLNLRGPITFDSHTNLRSGNLHTTPISCEHLAIESKEKSAPTPAVSQTFRHARMGDTTKRFCIYKTSDGGNVPALAIDYVPSYKLTRGEVAAGLQCEIQPELDVIDQEGEGFDFASKSLVAAAITQLFSCMVTKGIQFGYICTGETFIFLRIPDDPTIVYCSVCVPRLDVLDNDKNRLHYTAFAQVFAFILQALGTMPPPLGWFDLAVKSLKTWAIDYDAVLKRIRKTVRKQPQATLPYKPRLWKGFPPVHENQNDSDGGSNEGFPASLSLYQTHIACALGNNPATAGHRQEQPGTGNLPAKTPIESRSFCTHECLAGLANRGPLDQSCPNAADHGQQHLDPLEFLSLIRAQLAQDRGPDADAMTLYRSGAIGSLFKVRLSAHGYTVVAKGVERNCLKNLNHERKIYDRLRPVQGKHVPVCLGMVDLALPYYSNAGVFEYFMFLSWAGWPLYSIMKQAVEKDRQPLLDIQTTDHAIIEEVATAFDAIHELGVLHRDVELRNLLYGTRLMVIDFERADGYDGELLSLVNPNPGETWYERRYRKGTDRCAAEKREVMAIVEHRLEEL